MPAKKDNPPSNQEMLTLLLLANIDLFLREPTKDSLELVGEDLIDTAKLESLLDFFNRITNILNRITYISRVDSKIRNIGYGLIPDQSRLKVYDNISSTEDVQKIIKTTTTPCIVLFRFSKTPGIEIVGFVYQKETKTITKSVQRQLNSRLIRYERVE